MKKRGSTVLLLVLSLLLGLTPTAWAVQREELMLYQQNEKYGVIRKGGTEIVPPIYDYVSIEDNGTIRVYIYGETGETEGLYSWEGKEILPAIYRYIWTQEDGNLEVEMETPLENGEVQRRSGLFDPQGKELLPVIYDSIGHISEGRRRVELDGKVGFMDENFQVVIPYRYDDAMWFEHGLAQVGDGDGLYGVIDREGKEVLPCAYNGINIYEGGLIVAEQYNARGARCGLFDREGKELLPMEYDGIRGCGDDRYFTLWKWGETSVAYGLADREGKIVLPLAYQGIDQTADGNWRVLRNDKCGVLDQNFQTLIPIVYDSVFDEENHEDYYTACREDKWGLLDREGKTVLPLEYDELSWLAEDVCLADKGGKKGLIRCPGGEILAPFLYDETYHLGGPYLIVARDGLMGALDLKTGAVLVPVEFDAVSEWGEGYTGPDHVIITRKGDLFGAYDETGKELFPCQFGTLERLSGALRSGEDDPAGVGETSQAAGLQVTWYPEAERLTRIYGSDRMALVKNGRYALFGLDGIQYTGYDFDAIGEMRAPGEFMAAKDGKWGIIDGFGTPLTDFFWETQEEARDEVGARFVSKWADGSAPYALVDRNGKLLTDYKFWSYRPFSHGVSWASDGKAYGLVDAAGRELTPFRYDIVEDIQEDGFAIVYQYDGRKYNAVDATGRELWSQAEPYAGIWRAGCGLWGRGYRDGTAAFWNERGEQAFPGVYRYTTSPKGQMYGNVFDKNGVAQVYLESGESVFIDTQGNQVEGPTDWDEGTETDLHEGLIWARRDGMTLPGEWELEKGWGFKDEAGNLVVPYLYDAVGYFDQGCASVRLDGVYGLLKSPLTVAAEETALAGLDILWLDGAEGELTPLGSDQLVTDFVVRGTGRWQSPYGDHGLWSVEGEHLLTADQAGAVGSCPQGPSSARIYAMSGEKIDTGEPGEDTRYTDILGRTYLESEIWDWDAPWNPPELDCSRAVNPDTNRIEDGKYFYADPWTGEIVLPAIYDEAASFSDGIGLVTIDGDHFAIDRTGARLFDLNEYRSYGWFEGGRLRVEDKETGKQGFLDKTGEPIGPGLVWDEVGGFYGGTAAVSKNGRWGIVDLEGSELIPCVFDDISGFVDGIATVTLDGRQGILRDPRYKEKVSDWAQAEVTAAAAEGFVTESCREYQAFTITRRQFAELAVNYLEKTTGEVIAPAPADTFTDTADETVRKAYAAGIVQGVGEGKFSPGGLLTREQLSAMLWRAMSKAGATVEVPADLSAYADGEEVSSWAQESLSALVGLEIMAGTGDNRLSPKDSCTVEQALLLVYRGTK